MILYPVIDVLKQTSPVTVPCNLDHDLKKIYRFEELK